MIISEVGVLLDLLQDLISSNSRPVGRMAPEKNINELKKETPEIVPDDPTKKKKKKVSFQDPADEPVVKLVEKTENVSGVNDPRFLDDQRQPFKRHMADDSIRSPSKLAVSGSHGPMRVKRPVNELLDDRLKLKSVGAGAKTNTPKPIIKDSRVFGQVSPWEDTMKAAREEGTLVLLQNLDPTYTSSEIEDIIWHSSRENCMAKVLNCAAISSPHSGQAFAIFRTSKAAVTVVRKLEEGCLMLPNGRPLLGHVAVGYLPVKSSPFTGHIHIDSVKFSMQRDKVMLYSAFPLLQFISRIRHTQAFYLASYMFFQRDAVSTSHSSQPGTLEYDMAMEWCLLQERSALARRNLFKKQGEEVKNLKGILKRKF